MDQYGRDQREYIRFRESDSSDSFETDGSFTGSSHPGRYRGINRFGEERIRHDSFQDDPYHAHSDDHTWSEDPRSESFSEDHSGKGPRGYTRSSERIKEQANAILTRDFNLDASGIEVVVQEDILVLKGDVLDRHDKKLAEYLVEDIPGVSHVHNHLTIREKNLSGWIPGIGGLREQRH